jgi:uncharacterized protein (DUF2132 family)
MASATVDSEAQISVLTKTMTEQTEQPISGDPLHGVTLKAILSELVAEFGWEELGKRIDIRCFTHAPSLASSLKFLRRTPWARDKVEEMYLRWKM